MYTKFQNDVIPVIKFCQNTTFFREYDGPMTGLVSSAKSLSDDIMVVLKKLQRNINNIDKHLAFKTFGELSRYSMQLLIEIYIDISNVKVKLPACKSYLSTLEAHNQITQEHEKNKPFELYLKNILSLQTFFDFAIEHFKLPIERILRTKSQLLEHETVEKLAFANVDLNSCGKKTKRTPLHWAVISKKNNLTDQDTTIARLCLLGANPNTQDHEKNTALHLACLQNNYQALYRLMTFYPNLNVRNNDQKTVIDLLKDKLNQNNSEEIDNAINAILESMLNYQATELNFTKHHEERKRIIRSFDNRVLMRAGLAFKSVLTKTPASQIIKRDTLQCNNGVKELGITFFLYPYFKKIIAHHSGMEYLGANLDCSLLNINPSMLNSDRGHQLLQLYEKSSKNARLTIECKTLIALISEHLTIDPVLPPIARNNKILNEKLSGITSLSEKDANIRLSNFRSELTKDYCIENTQTHFISKLKRITQVRWIKVQDNNNCDFLAGLFHINQKDLLEKIFSDPSLSANTDFEIKFNVLDNIDRNIAPFFIEYNEQQIKLFINVWNKYNQSEFTTLSVIDQETYYTYLFLALTRYQVSDPITSLHFAYKALLINPTGGKALKMLSLCHHDLDDFSTAVQYIESTLQFYGPNEHIYQMLAENHMQTVLKTYNNNYTGRMHDPKLARAKKYCEDSLEVKPTPAAHFLHAKVLFLLQQKKAATKELKNSLKLMKQRAFSPSRTLNPFQVNAIKNYLSTPLKSRDETIFTNGVSITKQAENLSSSNPKKK